MIKIIGIHSDDSVLLIPSHIKEFKVKKVGYVERWNGGVSYYEAWCKKGKKLKKIIFAEGIREIALGAFEEFKGMEVCKNC